MPSTSQFPLDQLEAQKALLQGYVDEQQALEVGLKELREKLQEAQEKREQSGRRALQNELAELREQSNLVEITGEGVEILLADGIKITRDNTDPDSDELIHAADVRDLLNLLFLAGSEGVAINGRRVLPLYSVNVVGNTFFIHDFYAFPPFTVTAVGDMDVLIARLNDESLLPSIQKRSGSKKIRFSVQRRAELTLPAFSGARRTNSLTHYSEE